LRSTEQLFSLLNVHTVDSQGDLTARATIRNSALRLFAERGPDAVTVRQIAADARVSPALVLHHFGSKAGLREAVDSFAANSFDAVMEAGGRDELAQDLAHGNSSTLAAAFAQVFPPDSPLPAYLRRLLLSGDPAGTDVFRRWLDGTEQLLAALADAGLATPTDAPRLRAAFLLANDLAVVLLRDPLRETLGFDPLSPEGIQRWGVEVTAVYTQGVWKGEEG
jgi:AcrR family transcriptional regulator